MEDDVNTQTSPAAAEASDEMKEVKESSDERDGDEPANIPPTTPGKAPLSAAVSQEDASSERSSTRMSWGGLSRLAAMATGAFGTSPTTANPEPPAPAAHVRTPSFLQSAERSAEEPGEVEVEKASEEEVLKDQRVQQLHALAPPSLAMSPDEIHRRSSSCVSPKSALTDTSTPRELQSHARRRSFAGQTKQSETGQVDLPGLLSTDNSDWTRVAKPLRHRIDPSPGHADSKCPSTPQSPEVDDEGEPAQASRLAHAGATPAHGQGMPRDRKASQRDASRDRAGSDPSDQNSPRILRSRLSGRSQSAQALVPDRASPGHSRRVSFSTAVDFSPSGARRKRSSRVMFPTAEELEASFVSEDLQVGRSSEAEQEAVGRVRRSHAEVAAAVERMLDPARGSLKLAKENILDELLTDLRGELLEDDFVIKSWIVDQLDNGSVIEECEGDQIGLVASSASIAFQIEASERWCCVYEWKGEHSDISARASLQSFSEQLLRRSSAPPEKRYSRKIDDGSEPPFFFQALQRKNLSLRKLQPHLRGRRRTSPLAAGVSWSLVRAPQLTDPNAPERGQAEGSEIWNSFWCFEVIGLPDWSGRSSPEAVTVTEVDIPSALHGCRSPHSCYVLVEVLPDLLGGSKAKGDEDDRKTSRIPLLGSPGYRSSSGSDPEKLLALSATLWIGAQAPESVVRWASKVSDDVRLIGLRAHMPAGQGKKESGDRLTDSHLDSSMSSCVSYQDSLNFRKSFTGGTSGVLHSSPFISTTIWADGQDPGGVDDFLHRLAWASGTDKVEIESIAQAINDSSKDLSPRQNLEATDDVDATPPSLPDQAKAGGGNLRLWQVSEVLRRQGRDDFVTEIGPGYCFKQGHLADSLDAACLLHAGDQLWIWVGAYCAQSACDLANDIAHSYTMTHNDAEAASAEEGATQEQQRLQISGIVESGDEPIDFTRWFRGWLVDALPSRRKDAGANFPIPKSPVPRSPTSMQSSNAFSSPYALEGSPADSSTMSVQDPLDEVIQMICEKVPIEKDAKTFTSFFEKGTADTDEDGEQHNEVAETCQKGESVHLSSETSESSARKLFADVSRGDESLSSVVTANELQMKSTVSPCSGATVEPSTRHPTYGSNVDQQITSPEEIAGSDGSTLSPRSNIAFVSPSTDRSRGHEEDEPDVSSQGGSKSAHREESSSPSPYASASTQRTQHRHRPSDFPEFNVGRLTMETHDAPPKKETPNAVFGSAALLRSANSTEGLGSQNVSFLQEKAVAHISQIPRRDTSSFISISHRTAISELYWEKHKLKSVAENLRNLYESLRWAEQERDTLHRRIAWAAAQEMNAVGKSHQLKSSPFARLQQTLGSVESQGC